MWYGHRRIGCVLSGIVGICGTTPLKRRHTSLNKEGTTEIIIVSHCLHYDYFYPLLGVYLFTCYLASVCLIIGNFTLLHIYRIYLLCQD
jgi:hypothetical protein